MVALQMFKIRTYSVLKDCLLSIKSDEVAILFCPYPIVNVYQGSVFLLLTTDFLQVVFDELEKEINACQKALFLYPSMKEKMIVIRDARTKNREYIYAPEIAEYIKFNTVPVVE